MNKTDISEKIYYSVISVIIAVSAAWMMFLSWNFRIELQDIALWVILFALINTTRDVIKNRIVTAGVIIYIIVAVTVVGVMENNAVYAGILMGIFVVYMLSYRLTVHEVFRIAVGFVCVAGTFITFHYNGDIPKLLVVMTVILLLNSCVDCLYVAGVNKSSGRSLIAVYAVIGIFLLMTPVKSEPYGWKCIYMIADKTAGCLARLVNGLEYYIKNEADIYEFNYTQYTGNGRVNVGKLIDNDNVSVIVSGKKTANNLYLKGNVNAAFDGQRWYPADNLSDEAEYIYEAEKMHEADTWMTLYACYALSEDADDIKRYISLRTQMVTFENIRTKTAFVPAKLIKLTEQTYIDGDNIRFSKVLNKRNQYSYDFIDIDYSDASFNDVLRHSSEVAYSENTWNKMVSYMQDEYNIMPSFDYQDYLGYVKMCDDFADDVYLMVDDNVSGMCVILHQT